ncbi:Aste57867_24582 [Aphanomyces stellatus]|uniref:Aste57867_24582 protein n=1 Tax=Aphanomyces stellatus TaxID=120398 RepID=A0A485LSQ4_9STRA|nr:hypothetical protein As57867_024504 [Aphanomyces stellatus]VFU01221.1 Aste57867_24582 [Aphanomyces stellatus]
MGRQAARDLVEAARLTAGKIYKADKGGLPIYRAETEYVLDKAIGKLKPSGCVHAFKLRQLAFVPCFELVPLRKMEVTRLTAGHIDWEVHKRKNDIKIHKTRKGGVPIYHIQSGVAAALDDIAAIFLTTSTADTRDVNAIFFPNNIDEVRLYNLTLPTKAQPHLYQRISYPHCM